MIESRQGAFDAPGKRRDSCQAQPNYGSMTAPVRNQLLQPTSTNKNYQPDHAQLVLASPFAGILAPVDGATPASSRPTMGDAEAIRRDALRACRAIRHDQRV